MPSNDETTQRLAEMLAAAESGDTSLWDSEDREAEGLGGYRGSGVSQAAWNELEDAHEAQAVTRSPSRDEAAANPGLYFGRGPTGRLRNFRAMNDVKLRDTYNQVTRENNDREAMDACHAEGASRGLWS